VGVAKSTKDVKARKAMAASLQRQIEKLVSGRARPERPSSLREFVEKKMAEDRAKARKRKPSRG